MVVFLCDVSGDYVMNIRVATIDDLQEIIEVYNYAREFMAKTGNPHQWADGHPKKELLLSDFPLKRLYALEDEVGIAGVFMFDTNPDPTYSYIVVDKFQQHNPITHYLPTNLKETLELNKYYEFTYHIKGNGNIENIYDIINNIHIEHLDNEKLSVTLSIKETNKLGIDQIQENICN